MTQQAVGYEDFDIPLESGTLRVRRWGAPDAPAVVCVPGLSANLARRVNGVSLLHGQVSRKMFAGLWPGFDTGEVPIGSVTNGVQLLPAPVGPGSAAVPWCVPLGVAGQLRGRPAFPVRAYTQSSLTQECHLPPP